MPFTKGDPLARLAGRKASLRRWAVATPEQRAEQARKMNAGRFRRYVERARAIAATQGYEPSDKQLAETANALWLADLADRRYRAWQLAAGKTAERRAD